ncbi:MAG: FG-GAP repeat domain-containing protein, partial [Planctomycetota bacterium]
MARRTGRRRRQLLLRTLLPGVLVIIVALAWLLLFPSGKKARYTPGEAVPGITRELERRVPEGFAPVAFREVSREAGIDFTHFWGCRSIQLPEDMGSGLAWGDYDGDGDPDLYAVNQAGPLTERESWGKSPASSRLYRNDGNGTFTDVSARAGLEVRELGMAAVWADADSDGDLDLLLTHYGSMQLYRNDGDGSFTDVTREAGLEERGYWSGASFGDYDRDGDLDLYVCGYVHYTFDPADRKRTSSAYASVIPASLNPSTYKPQHNALFENDGEGHFADVTERAGVANVAGRSLGAAWCDFDEDGWLDLYVANDISDNVMYRNLGDGTFEDKSHASWVADYRGAMGMAIADWDSDHDLDMFITHWIAQENALYVNLLSEQKSLKSSGDQGFVQFQDDADQMGVGQIALDYIGWGSDFLDFDNDGRLDLFVVNGSTFQEKDRPDRLVPMRNLLFWNGG